MYYCVPEPVEGEASAPVINPGIQVKQYHQQQKKLKITSNFVYLVLLLRKYSFKKK